MEKIWNSDNSCRIRNRRRVLRALKRFESGENIQILFYFKSESIPIDEIIPEQIIKIRDFKEKLRQKNILYWNFSNTDELINQLRIHLPKRTDNLLNNSAINNISEATSIIAEEFKNKTNELDKIKKLPNFNKNLLAGILGRTAKSIDDYTNRLLLETPIYQDNFESAIKIGSIYINNINKDNLEENMTDLNTFLESVKNLKDNIPKAINGMDGFYNVIKDLPNLYSVFTKSKNKLLNQLDSLQSTLKASYSLTHEFEGELEYKLKL